MNYRIFSKNILSISLLSCLALTVINAHATPIESLSKNNRAESHILSISDIRSQNNTISDDEFETISNSSEDSEAPVNERIVQLRNHINIQSNSTDNQRSTHPQSSEKFVSPAPSRLSVALGSSVVPLGSPDGFKDAFDDGKEMFSQMLRGNSKPKQLNSSYKESDSNSAQRKAKFKETQDAINKKLNLQTVQPVPSDNFKSTPKLPNSFDEKSDSPAPPAPSGSSVVPPPPPLPPGSSVVPPPPPPPPGSSMASTPSASLKPPVAPKPLNSPNPLNQPKLRKPYALDNTPNNQPHFKENGPALVGLLKDDSPPKQPDSFDERSDSNLTQSTAPISSAPPVQDVAPTQPLPSIAINNMNNAVENTEYSEYYVKKIKNSIQVLIIK